jgi:hypothetical protein
MEAKLKQYETHMTMRVQQSEAIVDKATDTVVQEICKRSDNAVKTVTDQIQHTLNQAITTTQTTVPRQNHTAHRFPLALDRTRSPNSVNYPPTMSNPTKGNSETLQYYYDVRAAHGRQ